MTASTVRQVDATTAIAGTTMNIPSMPATAAPAGIATSTTAGWRWTILPYTSGVTMLPFTMLNTSVQMIMIAMSAVIRRRR